MNKKVICFDLDNVICKTKKNFYNKSKPKKNVIRFINQLYCDGFFIKIFTSRFMGRCKENVYRSKKKGFKFTERQLKKWNLKYNKLVFGKPSYDIFIDDKNLSFTQNWIPLLKKKLNINENIF
jgi:hypothetical protein